MPHLPRLATACAVLAAFTATASAKLERTVEKSFQVQPGVHLTVSTYGGEIRVDPSSDGVVKVVAKEHFRADSETEADDIMKKVDLTIEQRGNDVVATAVSRNGIGFHFGWPHDVQIDFVVTVPSSTSVELKTSGGDIAVGDLGGTVNARTSGGEVRLGKISGDIDASTSGGDVELADGRASVKLSTSGGNVTAGHLTGPSDAQDFGRRHQGRLSREHPRGGDERRKRARRLRRPAEGRLLALDFGRRGKGHRGAEGGIPSGREDKRRRCQRGRGHNHD